MMNNTRRTQRKSGKNSSNASQISTKSLKIAISRMAELKAVSVIATSLTVSTAGVVTPISQSIVEGSDANQRDGAVVRLKHIRGQFRAVAITNSQTVRFILFRDLMNNGTLPSVTDVLFNALWNSPYNVTTELQQKRFSIIKDWVVDVNLTSNVVQSSVFNRSALGNIYYNTSTNVTAANGKGSVFLLVIGSNSTGGYDYSVQLDYTDY